MKKKQIFGLILAINGSIAFWGSLFVTAQANVNYNMVYSTMGFGVFLSIVGFAIIFTKKNSNDQ